MAFVKQTCTDCPPGTFVDVAGAFSLPHSVPPAVCSSCVAMSRVSSLHSKLCAVAHWSGVDVQVYMFCARRARVAFAGLDRFAVCSSGASVCKFCPAGTWSNASGLTSSSSCNNCGTGTFGTGEGANSPVRLELGTAVVLLCGMLSKLQ